MKKSIIVSTICVLVLGFGFSSCTSEKKQETVGETITYTEDSVFYNTDGVVKAYPLVSTSKEDLAREDGHHSITYTYNKVYKYADGSSRIVPTTETVEACEVTYSDGTRELVPVKEEVVWEKLDAVVGDSVEISILVGLKNGMDGKIQALRLSKEEYDEAMKQAKRELNPSHISKW